MDNILLFAPLSGSQGRNSTGCCVPSMRICGDGKPLPVNAINDNDTTENPINIHSDIVKAALRLFAQNGLGSSDQARRNAERCFWANDSQGQKWWMAVLHQLDRQLLESQPPQQKSEQFSSETTIQH